MFISALPALKAARIHKMNELKMCRCFNCDAALAINIRTETYALAHPLRDGRPIEFIGIECCEAKFSDFLTDKPADRKPTRI
jgi:hypothetical protein